MTESAGTIPGGPGRRTDPMPEAERKALAEAVAANCGVSDARHAGMYSICGLALRLRDLYKWTCGLPPWQEGDPEAVLEWIGEQEARWERMAEREFAPVPVSGSHFDPFDVGGVNARLESFGLFYGAGYAYGLKPTFFLASIAGTTTVEGRTVAVLGREMARDMLTLPALTQDGVVVLRREAGRAWLWDRMQYCNASGRPSLNVALAAAGVRDADPERKLDRLMAAQEEAFLYHELAELKGDVLSPGTWRRLTADLGGTPAELFVRAVRDLLADTAPEGTLLRLARSRNTTAVALYAAFFEGLAREIFPELRAAFYAFVESGSWRSLAAAVPVGYRRAADLARRAEALHRRNPEAAAETIEETLLQPLTKRRKAGAVETQPNP